MLLAVPVALALTLTYEEALTRAGEANVDVRAAAQDVLAAEASLLAARSPFEPTLDASGSYYSQAEEGTSPQFGETYYEASGWNASAALVQPLATGTSLSVGMDSSQSRTLFRGQIEGFDFESEEDGQIASKLTFTLSQQLLQGHRLAWNLQGVRTAKGVRSIAEAMRQARRQQVLADTARQFWGARYQRSLADIAAQTWEIAKEQRRVAQALVEGGRLAPVEGTRAEALMVQAERASMLADSAARAAEEALLIGIGEPPGTALELVSAPSAPPALSLDEDAVVEAVLQGNPELVGLRIQLDTRRRALKDARHALLPALGGTASYALKGYEPTLAGSLAEAATGDFRDYSLGAQLSLPLFNRADRGALGQAEAAATLAELDVRRLEDGLTQAARAQVRTLEAASRDVELARLNVRLAEETLAAEQARLAEGRALQRDVSEALKGLDTARTEAERALTDYLVAVVELERLKGSL